jgi:two-component system CheB/CheR fusion protein
MPADPPAPPPDDAPGLPFLVAGVGASAGGLEAYAELLDALPPDPGLALVLVSHMMPDQKSHLADILARGCRLPVREVADGMRVEQNHVYVIPPNASMALTDGHLTLTVRPPKPAPHMPVDHLFRSLAAIQKGRAVGVVLSGNGSDGAIALQAIKAAGGVTFAQDETTAKNPGMPRAAVLEGSVDHVLRPREIADRLVRMARHPYARTDDPPAPPAAPPGDPVADIIDLLRARTAVDFTHYKQTTIRRRILRRMALRNLDTPADYLSVLRTTPPRCRGCTRTSSSG